MTSKFLEEVSHLVFNGVDSGYFPVWKEIPKNYQKNFKDWVAIYKQQTFEGYWKRGWELYCAEYIAFLLREKAKEVEK